MTSFRVSSALPTRESGFTETVRMDHIKDDSYYQGEITPIGPGLDYEQPHDRDCLPSADKTLRTT